jgi:hypothetical protein
MTETWHLGKQSQLWRVAELLQKDSGGRAVILGGRKGVSQQIVTESVEPTPASFAPKRIASHDMLTDPDLLSRREPGPPPTLHWPNDGRDPRRLWPGGR